MSGAGEAIQRREAAEEAAMPVESTDQRSLADDGRLAKGAVGRQMHVRRLSTRRAIAVVEEVKKCCCRLLLDLPKDANAPPSLSLSPHPPASPFTL
jgi:hypothetical protein